MAGVMQGLEHPKGPSPTQQATCTTTNTSNDQLLQGQPNHKPLVHMPMSVASRKGFDAAL